MGMLNWKILYRPPRGEVTGTILGFLKLMNANWNWAMQIGMQTLGGPLLWEGGGAETGDRRHGGRKLGWENANEPPLTLGGGLEFSCGLHLEIWDSGNHPSNQNNLKVPLRGRNLCREEPEIWSPPAVSRGGGVGLKTADETGGGCDASKTMLITSPPSRIFP